MAFTSFTLRRTISDGGSALRRTNVNQDASNPSGSGDFIFDSGLKADNYFPPVPPSYLESIFSVEIYKRGEIELSWRLETPLVESALNIFYEPVGLLIRASEDGEPITAGDGIEVINLTYSSYRESYTDIASVGRPYIADGKWAYYSLFVLYKNITGGSFYERLATLSVQTPINFGSTEDLWKRIPLHYRQLDQEYALTANEYPYEDGPLYRYISLFGWELDKIRTTIFDTMRISDPNVVHSSALDALAVQTGVEFNSDALGAAKLRSVLNNIGYLRRTKGTVGSVESYISALSGSGVTTLDTSGEKPIIFNVHPMRVNLITDPFFNQGVTDTDVDVVSSERIYRWWTDLTEVSRTYGWGLVASIPDVISSPVAQTTVNDKLTVTFPQATASGQFGYAQFYGRGYFGYNPSLTYYGSFDTTFDFDVYFGFGEGNLEAVFESSTPVEPLAVTSSVVTGESVKFSTSSRSVFSAVPLDGVPLGTPVYPVFLWKIPLSTTSPTVLTISKPLFEYKRSAGDFFSGNNPLGGFLPDAQGVTGEGIYDYHWGANAVGTADTDFSYYTADFYRSKKVAEYVVENYVMPVNLVKGTDYVINWDVIE